MGMPCDLGIYGNDVVFRNNIEGFSELNTK